MIGTRYWTVFALLASTAFTLHSRGDVDRVPVSDPVSTMPAVIDGLTAKDLAIDAGVLEVLGKGEFLNRVYEPPPGARGPAATPVGLFIGYFPTQRTGQTIHSPQHCLPGAGWTFESSRYTDLRSEDGRPYRVGEYVISNGDSKQFVLYWYQSHGRSIANEYVSKAYMIADAIRYNRTDGALVRVITPILPSEGADVARARALRFAAKMAPNLPRIIPG